MRPADPFAILGIDATRDETLIRRAWRRAALGCHPDTGGSAEEMRRLNWALDEALRSARASGVSEAGRGAAGSTGARGGARHGQRDMSSFTVRVPPTEAHLALEIVAAELGSVIVDDPPGMIEFTLHQSRADEGGHAWCRCELASEAGMTTVHVTVGADGFTPPPTIEEVRDLIVGSLNRIDWPGGR